MGANLQKSDLSSQNFLIQNTINIFFKFKPALPSGEWKESLRELFLTSEAARQDVMFFIDYMNSLSKLAEAFPFTETLSHLQSFFQDQTSISYYFLHASLHFFCGCSLFSNSVNKDPTSTFKRIYRMSTEERQFLDEYISTQKSITDLLLTEFPNSPEKNRLKKELIQFLGESAISEINMTLDLLPGFVDDRYGKVLSYYSKFIQIAIKTQNGNEMAIKNGEEPDIKGFIELENWQKKLDILLEQINVKKDKSKEINLTKNKIFEECQRTYSLAASLELWKNSNKKDSDNFRALVKCNVWKFSELQINQILDKLEVYNYCLTLSSEEIEVINTVFNAKHIINYAEISNFLAEHYNLRLKNLKNLLGFSCFFRELENFKKSEIVAKVLKFLKLFNIGEELEKKLDSFEEEQNENRQLLIYYLKSFKSNSEVKDELKIICKQEDYPLTEDQREDITILTNDKIDKIIEQNTLIINGSDPYSLFYINLAEELHETFRKESGTVEIIDFLPLPTLEQLKTAIALIQTKMRFLLLATFTDAERIAVAQLLRIIMIGKEEAMKLPLLTSDFAFSWKEASHYVLSEELFPLENMDILKSLLNGGTLINQTEKSRDQLLIQFFNDYVRGSTAGMYVNINGKQEIIKHEKGKMFFESLREFYFSFLNNHIYLIQEEIIYNKNNQDFISPKVTQDQFKSILLKCCLSSQNLEIEEIVQATTFTKEQMVWLKINSPDTDEQYLESLLRIKVLRCLVIWTQATTTIMLNQRINFGLQDTNLSAISCRFSLNGDLHGTARGCKWVIDTSLNSMTVNLIIYLREVNEFFDRFVCTYSQVLSMTGITSNNREDSKVKLISLDTLYVSPFTQVYIFDKIALSLG
jgi:hypothetical protein